MYNLRWIIDGTRWLKDQSALKQLMEKDASIESRLNIVPQKLLNAYLDNEAGAPWEPYHFIMHQVFCNDLDGCGANFTNVLKRVMPQLVDELEEVENKTMESGDLFSWVVDWLMNKKESYIG
jgi:hypothetical protein